MIDPEEKLKFVELEAYKPEWMNLFAASASEIKSILQDNCIEIHHIGSTAIPGIYAKPIIDVLVVVKDISKVDAFNAQFEMLSYVCMGEYGMPGRRFYWKSREKRTHNVHLFELGAHEISRHIQFKEFMLANQGYAKAYSLIKCCLAEKFPQDIVNYVDGKASFVQFIDYRAGVARQKQLNADDHIIIQAYNPAWPKLAQAEINAIKAMIGKLAYVQIEHLGSTSVDGLSSKPILDIFITIDDFSVAGEWIKVLEYLGYVFWQDNPDKTHMRFFKGLPPFGEKRTHHIHILKAGSDVFEHSVVFRDILRTDANIRQEYESLKMQLAQTDQVDREVYTDNKKSFIESVLRSHGCGG